MKLYINDISVLANDDELLTYIEIWYEIKVLFNKAFNKKIFYTKLIYNRYINTKINPYNKVYF